MYNGNNYYSIVENTPGQKEIKIEFFYRLQAMNVP